MPSSSNILHLSVMFDSVSLPNMYRFSPNYNVFLLVNVNAKVHGLSVDRTGRIWIP